MTYEHPFKEFHDDAKIGNLMWRISRRRGMSAESQNGSHINELGQKILSDKEELATLLAAYEETKS